MADHIPNVLDPFSAPYMSHTERAEAAAGLRAMADWLETTRFPVSSYAISPSGTIRMYSDWVNDESFVQRPATSAKLIGGRVEKGVQYDGGPFELRKDFGGGVAFTYSISRNAVCTAREVEKPVEGYHPVDTQEADLIKAQIEELERAHRELPREQKTVIAKITEYVCPPSLIEAEKKATVSATTDDIPF